MPEKSACLEGHHRTPLGTDHSYMSKYYGDKDPSYQLVSAAINNMAENTPTTRKHRRNQRTDAQFLESKTVALQNCLMKLEVTDPRDILANIRHQKGDRVGGTCKWILKRDEYKSWEENKHSAFLRIVGPPGIGKTMMTSFVIEELNKKFQRSPKKAILHFFCDDKGEEGRRMPTAILRSLIWQLLQQNENLVWHFQEDLKSIDKESLSETLFQNFAALWRIFKAMLLDKQAGEIFILIDALDESDRDSRGNLLAEIQNLFSSGSQSEKCSGKIKLLVTCRQNIPDIEMAFQGLGSSLKVNAKEIKSDLETYIEFQTGRLLCRNPGLIAYESKIVYALKAGTDGTFLWASLMVAEIGRPGLLNHQIEQLLENPPRQLDGLYASILNRIDPGHYSIARFILHCMVAAKRPLTEIEIMMAFATSFLPAKGTREHKLPRQKEAQKYNDILLACSSIIVSSKRNDRGSATLGFYHQSVKDFLLEDSSRTNHQWYETTIDKANLLVFQTFWKYLTAENLLLEQTLMGQLQQPARKYELQGKGERVSAPNRFLKWTKRAQAKQSECILLRYVYEMWEKHAISCYPAAKEGPGIILDEAPNLRDIWFLCAARSGQVGLLRLILRTNDAVLSVRDQYDATPLSLAAENGHADVVRVLLATRKVEIHSLNVRGQTPLFQAAGNGHLAVVKLLLATGKAQIEHSAQFGKRPLHRAAERGHLDVVKELLARGADIHSKDYFGNTAITFATNNGHRVVIDELLSRGANSVKTEKFVEDPTATQEEHDFGARAHAWLNE